MGRQVALVDTELTVGRGEECGLRIDDRGMSRVHAKLLRTSTNEVSVLDLQSTNGTWKNGERCQSAILRNGDELMFGPNTVVHFVAGAQPRAPESAAQRARVEQAITRRELEVATLVARGWPNQRIAKQLGVSVRTVESHLDHVYNKLDVDSRSALTALLYESGLVGSR
jgi:DNA-binding NarL/FixJ family response regulator